MSATSAPRRSQEERSADTRSRIMKATIDCVIEHGYAGTTVARVAERAGVSRGAQLYHYPSKAALVASAIEHLAARRGEEWSAAAGRRKGRRARAAEVLDAWWQDFQGPLFAATLELWVAARTDAELREQLRSVERQVARTIRARLPEALGAELVESPDFDRKIEMILATVRGLATLRLVEPEKNLKRSWAYSRGQLLDLLAGAATDTVQA